MVVMDEIGLPSSPWSLERAMRVAQGRVAGLAAGLRFHDLRHCLASLLIGSGSDVKGVQRACGTRTTTTLHTDGHVWAHAGESARAAVGAAGSTDGLVVYRALRTICGRERR